MKLLRVERVIFQTAYSKGLVYKHFKNQIVTTMSRLKDAMLDESIVYTHLNCGILISVQWISQTVIEHKA